MSLAQYAMAPGPKLAELRMRETYADPLQQVQRMRGQYRRMLRRAAKVGWHCARFEHVTAELLRGIPEQALGEELDFFEQLRQSAFRQGIDPVLSQRRSDVLDQWVRPMAATLGLLMVVACATAGISSMLAVGSAAFVTLFCEQLGRAVVLNLIS